MGRLWWRERWSALGCRRGWWRLAALVMIPVLAGYFGLYALLRASGDIWHEGHKLTDGTVNQIVGTRARWNFLNPFPPRHYYMDDRWPRESTTLMLMWPAIKLEAALDRWGYLPWTNIQ